MSTMDLSFLNDVEVEAVQPKTAKTRTTAPKLPADDEADLRVFANGKVYPSKAFAEEYNLEFQPKEEVKGEMVIVGNGLDIFPSTTWGMVAGKMPKDLIFVAAVPKAEPKVDMWASTKYDENNQPKASVFTQGTNTFAKTMLVPMLQEIYDVNWEEVEYVDLVVVREHVMASPNNLYHVPKVVSTGKHKGEPTYVRRENLTICPLVVKEISDKTIGDMQNEAPELDQAPGESNNSEDPGEDWADKLGE